MKIGDKVQLESGEAEVTRKVYDQSLKKTVFYAGDIRLTGSEKPVEAENIIAKKLEAVEAAIKSIPKVEIPEYPKFPAFPEPKDFPEFPAFPKEMTVNVPDLSSIEKKLDTIIRKEDNETKELIRNAIDELKKTKTDSGVISAIQKLSEIIPESQDYTDILKEISEKLTPIVQEDLKINKEQWKQLTTALSSIGGFGGGPSAVQLRDEAGDLFNPATEEKQDALSSYAPAGQDISGDPMYFAGLKADGSWYIKKMYLSGDYTSKYANGTSGFDWSTRASLSYVDFNTLTW